MSVDPNDGDDQQEVPLIEEADLILPTEQQPFSRAEEEDEARSPIIADELDAQVEPLYEDNGPVSVGILNAFQGIFDKPSLPRDGISLPTTEIRPFLRREGSGNQTTSTQPPLPPSDSSVLPLTSAIEVTAEPEQDIVGSDQPGTDSLSLQQLRALVRELPAKAEPAPYAFVYDDKASLMEELEEWFTYTTEERERIAQTYATFAGEWARFTDDLRQQNSQDMIDWSDVREDQRRQFIRKVTDDLRSSGRSRLFALETLVYLSLGSWYETAGKRSDSWLQVFDHSGSLSRSSSQNSIEDLDTSFDKKAEYRKALEARYEAHGLQIDWIQRNTVMILDNGGIAVLLDVVKSVLGRACHDDLTSTMDRDLEDRELWSAMTLLYVALEVTGSCTQEDLRMSLRRDFVRAKSSILVTLGDAINELRWDESIPIPLSKILLLTWKSTLVLLGGLQRVEEAKSSFSSEDQTGRDEEDSKSTITATPLHYHSFRQEITSKYPAYTPPMGKFPLEPEQKSILPPLRQNHNVIRSTSFSSQSSQYGGSIFQQPVHIATPAPSPPPSPAAGKGGKKQNYQTNQLFPFLYPPLDATSNSLGGKGTTFVQDSLVGRRWEGADIPVSILEASELFSSRIRATRALKQMWEEREGFLRHERGWVDDDKKLELDRDIAKLDLDGVDQQQEERPLNGPMKAEATLRTVDGSVNDRLETVNECYRDGLPHLQSIVVVVLKTILSTLTSLITNPIGPSAGASTLYENGNGVPQVNGGETNGNSQYDVSTLSLDDLDTLRMQEITAKAASGIILLLLKWFKTSHVLKFEYMCQLLVDANYIPIVLKLLQSQEIERIVNCKAERQELNLFEYCRAISRNPAAPLGTASEEVNQLPSDSSEDECAPPPIKRYRDPPPNASTNPPPLQPQLTQPPEVDELGLPTTELPSSPITYYSWRNFFSSINFLRVLQKICKHKAHRNLMLVQYKSAAYLKKALRIPQRELRLYTLKLFKNQVPYCGRKWRQSNMRVITAVYLHCRPELRDDWLLSADVDADVESAVPMEQSLRALTHYYNLKHYGSQMGPQNEGLEDKDYFERELDKLEWLDDEGEYENGGNGSNGNGQQQSQMPMPHEAGWDAAIERL